MVRAQDHFNAEHQRMEVLTVVCEVCVQVLGGPEARPDLLQLARLGGDLPLVDLLGHFLSQLCIVRRI